MELTKENSEDISRPESSSHVNVSSTEVGRISPTSPMSLVLIKDMPDIQDHSAEAEEDFNSPDNPFDKDPSRAVSVVGLEKDPELQKAIGEIKRLDIILDSLVSKENELKHRGEELRQKQWSEMQTQPKRSPECADEAENKWRFWSLTNAHESSEEADFVSVFGTQVPEQDYEKDSRHTGGSEKELNNTCSLRPASGPGGQVVLTQKEKDRLAELLRDIEDEEGDSAGIADCELESGSGDQVVLTQKDKDRLAELLRDIEDEEGDSAGTADCEEDQCVVTPVPAGQGYTPEPAELDQLIHIDSMLQLLLPAEDFLSVRSPYPERNLPQGPEATWDSETGEKVLQDIRERRDQEERRLQEIEEQLDILRRGQEATCDTPSLAGEELRSLLEECELAQSLLGNTPRLSDSLLSDLLRDPYTTSFFSQLETGTTT